MDNIQTYSQSKKKRINYLQFLKKYGIRILFQYIIDALLFDVVHKTDTYTRIYDDDYLKKSPGMGYMPSAAEDLKPAYSRDVLNQLNSRKIK